MFVGDKFVDPLLRRRTIALAAMTFLLLVILRYYFLPLILYKSAASWGEVISTLLDGLIIAVATSTIITGVISWLTPNNRMNEILILKPTANLKEYLSEDLKGSTLFMYKGHTGRWTRSQTLPALASMARLEREQKDIYLVILDPRSKEACDHLANLDAVREPSVSIEAHRKRVREELFATILNAYAWTVEEPRLRIRVALHQYFSLFRIDVSDRSAIVTRSSPLDYAVRYGRNCDFYRSFRDEVRLAFDQSQRLPEHVVGLPRSKLSTETAKILLESLGFSGDDYEGLDMNTIVNLASIAKNPYPH